MIRNVRVNFLNSLYLNLKFGLLMKKMSHTYYIIASLALGFSYNRNDTVNIGTESGILADITRLNHAVLWVG